MSTQEHVNILMSDTLAPASAKFPNKMAKEIIAALYEQYGTSRFFITVNVEPGFTEIERKDHG